MPSAHKPRAFTKDIIMIKAVIFDLDGVIIDSEPVAYGILRDMVAPYGGDISLDEYTTQYLGRTVAMGMTTIKNTFNIPESEEELFQKYMSMEKERVAKGIPLKAGLREILTYLKERNIKTIVASSSVRERAEKILRAHDILKYFDDLVFGYEVPKGKPHPDIFLKACEKLGVTTDEAIVIEDSEAGINASYSANIPVICIPDMKYPQKKYEDMATYVAESLYDATKIIEEKYEQM